MPAPAPRRLPAPRVVLAPDFLARAERFAARFGAARSTREGLARAARGSPGHEFAGYRPYRAGDDLRRLDWDLLARGERPHVRRTLPEVGERWCVLLDASASMGVGPPGKLQRAAECALALGLCALRLRARAVVASVGGSSGELAHELTRAAELGPLLARMSTLEAGGAPDASAWRAAAQHARGCQRFFLLSDLLDVPLEPLLAGLARGAEARVLQILAPLEIAPPEEASVRWLAAEHEEQLELELDPAARTAYARALEEQRSLARAVCARHGAHLAAGSTPSAFEDLLREALA